MTDIGSGRTRGRCSLRWEHVDAWPQFHTLLPAWFLEDAIPIHGGHCHLLDMLHPGAQRTQRHLEASAVLSRSLPLEVLMPTHSLKELQLRSLLACDLGDGMWTPLNDNVKAASSLTGETQTASPLKASDRGCMHLSRGNAYCSGNGVW